MILEVKQVGFDYAESELDRGLKPLLADICFSVSDGALLQIYGQNGSGKTTLLKLMAGLLRPQSGTICFSGRDILQQISFYQSQLCYVGHKTGISLALTVLENAQYDLKNDCGEHLSAALSRLGLSAFQDTPCGLLSVGQRRRVGLLRLLLSNAPLWILDEPLSALDKASVHVLMDMMAEHQSKGGVIIFTSHQSFPGRMQGYGEYRLC